MIPPRIGLIGAGKHGSRYARHIVVDLHEELRLVALCRRDRAAGEAAAQQYGCRYTPDIDAILMSPNVDAVAIVVPPTLHAEICEAAIAAADAARADVKAGKPIFTGPINKQDGSVWLKEGEVSDDGTLLGMNFYVEGIEGDIPQ